MSGCSGLFKLAGAISLVVLFNSRVAAEELRSAYQDISLKSCKEIGAKRAGQGNSDHATTRYDCGRFAGYQAFYTELPNMKELRFAVAERGSQIGTDTAVHLRFVSGLGTRIEWRGRSPSGRFVAKAAIIRTGWFMGEPKASSVLNILKTDAGHICLAAVVDASLNRDANLLARRAADALDDFICGKSQVTILGKESAAARDARDQVN